MRTIKNNSLKLQIDKNLALLLTKIIILQFSNLLIKHTKQGKKIQQFQLTILLYGMYLSFVGQGVNHV